ncbi:thioesterase [Treponema vincentii]|jgi:dihydrolipoamide acyltransferase|uniref:thioesterase family protein n=1 Tax=Treponema vincentii TaxID=69710 RepID=UPI0020A5FACF|nr:thioesterase [Treponema vincentii]UTC46635.1 thioesterase [Treponema vincentii]UTC49009.1 thioesterase [Treponema vincentii]UTC59480.1 thioesterase [Treponema vincentii]
MKIGIKGDTSFTVTKEMLASQDGDDTLEVFSTPTMVLKIERTAALSVLPFMEEGYTMVGVKIDVQHTAATLEGMKVFVHTELIDISENGKFLTFKAEVSNEKGIIGTGTHVRAIVNKKRFMEKLRAAVSEG